MKHSTTDAQGPEGPFDRRSPRAVRFALGGLMAVFVALAAGACEDDPFGLNDWTANPETALIYSLSLGDLNLASAFDFTERAERPVAVRDEFGRFNNWDVALDEQDGQLVLLPQTALGIPSDAAIVEIPNMAFSSLEEAPADTTLYVSDAPITMRTSSVYVVRTRQVVRQSFFTSQCIYYAKLQPQRVDLVEGILEFLYDVNTEFSGCNNRALVPPED